MTVIYSSNWEILDARYRIGFSGESNTEDLYIIPDKLEDYTYVLDCQNGPDKGVIPLEKTKTPQGTDTLHARLASDQIGPAGTILMQLVGRNSEGETVKKSNVFHGIVRNSINSGISGTPQNVFDKYAAQTGENADKAKTYADNAEHDMKRAQQLLSDTTDAKEKARASEINASEAAKNSEKWAGLSEQAANQSGWMQTYYDEDDNLMLERSDTMTDVDLRYDESDNLEVLYT